MYNCSRQAVEALGQQPVPDENADAVMGAHSNGELLLHWLTKMGAHFDCELLDCSAKST